MGPRIHSHLNVDAPLMGPAQHKPICSVQHPVGTGVHTDFISPTPITRLSPSVTNFLLYSVLYCYLTLPYFFSCPTGFGMPRKHVGYFPETPHATWHRSLWNGDSVEASVDRGSPRPRGGMLGWGSLQAAWNSGESGPDGDAQWSTAREEM